MSAKLSDGWVDYSKGRHLFVTKGISAEAQNEDAIRLVNEGKEYNHTVYVHYHQYLAKCVEQCRFYTQETVQREEGSKYDPTFTFENEDNQVAE